MILEDYKPKLFMGIVIIASGIVFSTTLSDKVGSLGIVFNGIGELLLIFGMKKKETRRSGER